MPNSIKNIYDIYKLLADYFSKNQKKKKRKKFKEKKTGVLIGIFQKENMHFNFSCKLK